MHTRSQRQCVSVTFNISETITIDRPADVVRRHFADVAHHQDTGVHRGVSFEVLEDDGQRCRYRQVSSVGPLRLTQEFELPRTDSGPLVNTITRGQFRGGTITFDVEPRDDGRATVSATVASRVRGLEALMSPLLRVMVRRTLSRALVEDKTDLENGNYAG